MGVYEQHMLEMQHSAEMIVQFQKTMIQRYGNREAMNKRACGLDDGPTWKDSPDKPSGGMSGTFAAHIGSYDIYVDVISTDSAFLMIRSDEPGDYITTNFPVNYVRGFFENYLQ